MRKKYRGLPTFGECCRLKMDRFINGLFHQCGECGPASRAETRALISRDQHGFPWMPHLHDCQRELSRQNLSMSNGIGRNRDFQIDFAKLIHCAGNKA